MNKQLFSLLLSVLISVLSVNAQEIKLKTKLDYFFDNTEFGRTTLATSQTMTGTHFVPEMEMQIEKGMSMNAGVDVMTLAGSNRFVENVFPLIYFKYETEGQQVYVGAFNRSDVLPEYDDFFFQDSIRYFRPNMHGMLWKKGSESAYVKLWLDWTGHQTPTDNETFFVGLAARKSINGFYADFKSYMFHKATTRPRIENTYVSDNVLSAFRLGYSSK